MLKKILIALVAIVVVFAVVVALQPSEFRVVRSAASVAKLPARAESDSQDSIRIRTRTSVVPPAGTVKCVWPEVSSTAR